MPLNLPDKLPAIELLKEENIFVIDNSRANAQDIRPLKIVIESDAVEDNYRDGFGAFAFQHSASVGDFVYETQKPYFKEYAGGAHESILSRF